jgi:hypothetical protein
MVHTMKTLRIIAEATLTEKEANHIIKTGKIFWDVDVPVAKILGKDIKFVRASIVAYIPEI